MNEHREELEDIIRQGVAVDLFHADEALSLDMFVGQQANEINKATFGAFFASLQIMLIRNLILHVAKMYEKPKEPTKRNPNPYPIRSIPSAIESLKANGEHLAIEQRHGLIAALARRGDPCVALCALHAISKGLVLGPVDVAGLAALMHEGELVESQWLLAYEANVKGWLPNLGGIDFVAASKHFGPMKAAGVSFYDEAATLPITVKPVVAKDYGSADEDFDLELEYLLGGVSG